MATWIPTTCCGTARNVGKSSAAPAGPVSFAASLPALVVSIPAIEDGIAAIAGETMKLVQLHWRAASGPQSRFRQGFDLAICQQIAGERLRFLGKKAASIGGAEDDGGGRVLEAEAAQCPPTIRATPVEVIEAVSERSTSRLLRPWPWPIPLLAVWSLRPLRSLPRLPRLPRWRTATPWHPKHRGIARWRSHKWPDLIKVDLPMDILWLRWLLPIPKL